MQQEPSTAAELAKLHKRGCDALPSAFDEGDLRGWLVVVGREEGLGADMPRDISMIVPWFATWNYHAQRVDLVDDVDFSGFGAWL
jgi:hypothetical protein